jgi:hypothetical protein
MVKATLKNSYGYRDPATGIRRYYGPGEVDIPEGLARTLGIKEAKAGGVAGVGPELPLDTTQGVPDELPDDWYTAGSAVSHVDYPEDPEASDNLPDDFPGREHLEAAGYTTTYQVKALAFDELVTLPGIGKATARKIISAMGEVE